MTAGSTASAVTHSSSPSTESQKSGMISRPMSAASQALLFDPNEIVDDNSVVADLVRQNVSLLQRCLKSSSKAVFFAAIENIKMASDNFGPAINKHLPILLGLIRKKQDLANKERLVSLKQTLLANGGHDARAMIASVQLKWD
jgi:hypothetical protein